VIQRRYRGSRCARLSPSPFPSPSPSPFPSPSPSPILLVTPVRMHDYAQSQHQVDGRKKTASSGGFDAGEDERLKAALRTRATNTKTNSKPATATATSTATTTGTNTHNEPPAKTDENGKKSNVVQTRKHYPRSEETLTYRRRCDSPENGSKAPLAEDTNRRPSLHIEIASRVSAVGKLSWHGHCCFRSSTGAYAC
jgi:hypothetical protein